MRLWARLLPVAFVTAMLVAAAEFGVAYGLGVVRFDRDFTAADNDWNLQLTWVAWFALVACVAGAVFAAWLSREGIRILLRLGVTFAAVLGSAVVSLPLTVSPVQDTVLDARFDPVLTAGLAAVAGALAGGVLAPLFMLHPPLNSNFFTCCALVWTIAGVSFGQSVHYGLAGEYDPVRLGVLDISQLAPIPRASFTMSLVALVVGVTCALIARWRRRPRIFIALSGVAGPLGVALAYLIGGPGLDRELTYQADGYLGALIAVVVGLIPSFLVALPPARTVEAAASSARRRTNSSA